MLGVVTSDGGDADDTTSDVDAEVESAAGTVFDTVDEVVPNSEPEASGATKVESDTLIGAETGTLADPGSNVWTAAGTLSTGSGAGNEFGGAAGAVSGTGVDFGSSAGAVAVDSVVVDSVAVASVAAAVAAAASSIALSGTVAMAGGVVVTCAGGAGDKGGSKRSEGTAGFNKSEPGPETDDKSEMNCCSSAGPICRLGVAG